MISIRSGGYRFSVRPLPTVAAVLFVLLTVNLGNWQTRRAEEKLALQRQSDAAAGTVVQLGASPVVAQDLAQRRVKVSGAFVTSQTLFVDNRVHRGAPGYHVVTPLRIGDSDRHVMINRGWAPAGPSRERLPQVSTPQGKVEIEGIAVIPPTQIYELAPDTQAGPVWQHLVLERIALATKLDLQPVVVLQTSATPDGLVREWPKPDAGADMHRAYALQWYVMALAAAVLWFVLTLRRKQAGKKA